MAASPCLLVHTPFKHPTGWGGSEKYWLDAVTSRPLLDGARTHIAMRRNEVAVEKLSPLGQVGIDVTWVDPVVPSRPRRVVRYVGRRLGIRTKDLERARWTRIFNDVRPDVFWVHLPTMGNYSDVQTPVAIARERGIPYWVVPLHAFDHWFAGDDRDTDDLRAVLAPATRVIFVAEENRRTVERAIGDTLQNAEFIPTNVSDDFLADARRVERARPAGSNGDEVVLLNLARFEPDIKGQHLLLEVLALPHWRKRKWKLVLAGGGRLTNLLSRLLTFYELDESRVVLVPHQERVLDVIAGADLAIMPSLSEGTPYALLESMAAGRPAVGTPVGGIPAIIRDGETGWLAEAAAARQLDDALERAWHDRERWAELGHGAANLVSARYRAQAAHLRLRDLLWMDSGRNVA